MNTQINFESSIILYKANSCSRDRRQKNIFKVAEMHLHESLGEVANGKNKEYMNEKKNYEFSKGHLYKRDYKDCRVAWSH